MNTAAMSAPPLMPVERVVLNNMSPVGARLAREEAGQFNISAD
ncbi:hypothetical protein ACW9HW_18455 [Pseudomonas sp. SDO5532_S415]|jgi:hypothetical protein|nr:hypothetical protein [Pseudomonas sp. Irchel 3A7]